MAARQSKAKGDEKSPEVAQDVRTVSAPIVVASTKDGRVVQLYKGDIVPDSLTDASLEHLQSLGFVSDEPQQ